MRAPPMPVRTCLEVIGPGSTRRLARRAIPLLAVAGVLAGAGPACATQRFAAPAGDTSGTNNCTSAASPCALTRAVNSVAVAGGDEVILAAGTYVLSGAGITDSTGGLDIHGPANSHAAKISANTSGPALRAL